MKIHLKILIILVLFLSISCELEEEVYDRLTPETMFKTEIDAEASIMGAYWELTSYAMYKDYLTGLLFATNDGLILKKSTNDRGKLARKVLDASSVRAHRAWLGWFNIINNSHLTLLYVPDISMNEAKKTRILGEAHFLVGYSYFNLIRMFGKAPLKLAATLDDSNLNTPMATKEQLFEVVLEHLKMAEDMCVLKSDQPSSEGGRATKGAVQALLADVYLNLEDWANAEIYADKVINSNEYSLVPDYADLWDVEKEAYVEGLEVIFAIQFKRDFSNTQYSARGNSFTYRVNPGNAQGRTGHTSYGKGGNEIMVQPWFYDICTTGDYEGDYRGEVSFLTEYIDKKDNMRYAYPNPNPKDKYPWTDKYKDPLGPDFLNSEGDMNIYRLSEIYIMKAEAANELGKTGEAYIAFNKLRERARLADGDERTTPLDLTSGLSKDDFRHAIFTERGVEFNFELKRWFDLKRMKRADGQTYFDYMYNEYIPSLPDSKKYKATLVYDPTYKLLPIPLDELNRNSSMSYDDQNPGY